VTDRASLSKFLDRESIPHGYRIKHETKDFAINWKAMTKALFPDREASELKLQYAHLKRLEKEKQKRVEFTTNTHNE
jgi:hypothetical protein